MPNDPVPDYFTPSFFTVGPDGNLTSIQSSDYVPTDDNTDVGRGFRLFDQASVFPSAPWLTRGGIDAGNARFQELEVSTHTTLRATTQAIDLNTVNLTQDSGGGLRVSPDLRVSSLPVAPADGTEVYYEYASAIVWHLIYNSSTGRWVYLGGPPISQEVTTSSTRANVAYGNLAAGAAGPSITLPLAGDYLVAIGCQLACNAVAFSLMSYTIGGAAASDNDAISQALAVNEQAYPWRERVKAIAAAATTLTAVYRSTAGTLTAANRFIRATPVTLIP